jgi:hypothetical protein
MITIPIDFPTYNHTSHPTIPSIDTFNNDIDSVLPPQSTRQHKHTSLPQIVPNPNLDRTLPYNPEAAQLSYSLARFEGNFDYWADAVILAFIFTRDEEGLHVYIKRMVSGTYDGAGSYQCSPYSAVAGRFMH